MFNCCFLIQAEVTLCWLLGDEKDDTLIFLYELTSLEHLIFIIGSIKQN